MGEHTEYRVYGCCELANARVEELEAEIGKPVSAWRETTARMFVDIIDGHLRTLGLLDTRQVILRQAADMIDRAGADSQWVEVLTDAAGEGGP